MTEADKKKIATILEKHGVLVGYLFGSAARGTMGPHSDIDIGVVFDKELSAQDDFHRRMKLAEEISRTFNVPETDIINLKSAKGILIKYQAIFGGQLILEKGRDMRFTVEKEVVRAYEDSRSLRRIMRSVLRSELIDGSFGRFLAK